MATSRRLQGIRELIEREDSRPPQADSRREELVRVEEVVARIRPDRAPFAAEARLERLRADGASAGRRQGAFDFTKADLSKLRGKGARVIEALYSALRAPVLKASAFFSNFPAARTLEEDIAASNLQFSPETYMIASVTSSVLVGMVAGALAFAIAASPGGAAELAASALFSTIVGGLAFFATSVAMLSYPAFRAAERARAVDRELPFALRHLATQLRAGVPFQKALASVARANYGTLSAELRKLLAGLESGESTDFALSALSRRTKSKGLRQASMQMLRSLRTGGSIAQVISEIADDVSFEAQMRIRDFTEQLNLVSVVFIMVAVVTPVILTILSAVNQLPLIGGAFSAFTVAASFAIIVTCMALILAFIKAVEPTS